MPWTHGLEFEAYRRERFAEEPPLLSAELHSFETVGFCSRLCFSKVIIRLNKPIALHSRRSAEVLPVEPVAFARRSRRLTPSFDVSLHHNSFLQNGCLAAYQ